METVPSGLLQRLAQRGLVTGFPCGQRAWEPCVLPENSPYFRPGEYSTRAQMAEMVADTAGISQSGGEQIYQDVPPGSMAYDEINTLTRLGHLTGYPCGVAPAPPCEPGNLPFYLPDNFATRGQAVELAARIYFPNCGPFDKPIAQPIATVPSDGIPASAETPSAITVPGPVPTP